MWTKCQSCQLRVGVRVGKKELVAALLFGMSLCFDELCPHQEHDCLLVELLLCFTAEEAVDKGGTA